MVRRRSRCMVVIGPLVSVAIMAMAPGMSAAWAARSTHNASLTWVRMHPQTSPPADSGAPMAYFPPTGQVVLFGRARPGSHFGETWLWDGVPWTRWTPTGDVPYDVGDTGGMAYDAATGKLVMFGGRTTDFYVDDTWTWDGTGWTKEAPARSPSIRLGLSMFTDPVSGHVVVFGGSYNDVEKHDTWMWDGSNRNRALPATSPPDRAYARAVLDSTIGQGVLFGGLKDGASLTDTWTWDGTTWTEQAPSTIPPARNFPGFADDAARGVVVMFGGEAITGELADTWFWTGQDWTEVHPARSPHGRDSASMAFDEARGDVVLFGGGDPFFSAR